MDKKTLVLKALFENQEMHFRAIVRVEGNPTVTKRILDDFIERGIVKKEGKGKRGKKIFYSLTKEGFRKYAGLAIDSVNESLAVVKKFSDIILSDPEKLEEWKRMSREAVSEIKTAREKPLDERMHLMNAKVNKIYTPLYESYINLHVILCLLSLPAPINSVPMFIGIDEGDLRLIPNQFLEDKGLLGPTALRLRSSISD